MGHLATASDIKSRNKCLHYYSAVRLAQKLLSPLLESVNLPTHWSILFIQKFTTFTYILHVMMLMMGSALNNCIQLLILLHSHTIFLMSL